MNVEFRKKIVDTLQEIQKELPTNDLVYNNIFIWPIIKFHFLLLLINQDNNFKSTSINKEHVVIVKLNLLKKIINKIKTGWQYYYLTIFYGKKNQIFTNGDWDHRVTENKLWINRYYVNLKSKRIHFELSPLKQSNIELKKDTYIAENLFYFHKHYYFNSCNIQLEQNEVFVKVLDLFNRKMNSNFSATDFNNKINNVFVWADLWTKILRQIKPKEIRMLCYYGTAMYGLCIAANQLSIPVIDMQHGVFGDLSPDYKNFGKIPEKTISSIPSHFSVWNLQSKLHLEKEKIVNSENILLEGNPWIIYNKGKLNHINNEIKNYIVYTLQTTVKIPKFMYDVIFETSKNYKWILKTHPRMSSSEIEDIEMNLRDLILLNKVEINSKSNLYTLLQSARVHVSAYSGSVLEAALLEVPTIINDRVGYETYKQNIVDHPDLYKFAETAEEFLNVMQLYITDNYSN